MENDIRPDDTEILLDEAAAPPGEGRAAEPLGACSMVWRGFVLGKQTTNPITSIYKNSEMEMGQDKTCGLIGKVKKHALRDGVICPWKTRALIFRPPLQSG